MTSTHSDNPSSWAHLHLPLQDSQQRSPPSPPAPIPIPSPALRARGLADLLDSTAETLAVDPDPRMSDLESGTAGPQTTGTLIDPEGGGRPERRRSLVGGLFSGLKRLPRALTKSYHPNERKTDRANDSVVITSLDSAVLANQPITLSPSSPPRVHALDDEQVSSPTLGASDQNHERLRTNNHGTTTPSDSSLTAGSDSDTPTPIYVEPNPTPDYAKMNPPPPQPPTEPSLASYLSRFRKFFKAINDLPWVAPRSTVDYIPGQFSHEQRSHPRRENLLSWYAAPPHHSLDLLSSGSPGEMTRLPDSSATLVYQSDLGVSPFHKSLAYNPPSFAHSGLGPGNSVRSQSVHFHVPTSRHQTSATSHPYPIMRPPPAWTS